MQTAVQTTATKKPSLFSAYNIVWAISMLFVFMFCYTALDKLKNPERFYNTIRGVAFIKPFASFLTYAVPYTELAISALLLFNTIPFFGKKIPSRKIGLVAGGGLMLSFIIYIVAMLIMYGKDLPCSCGGFISDLSWQAHIPFNLLFVGLALWGLRLYKRMSNR